MPALRLAIVQLNAGDDVAANIEKAVTMGAEAARGADLVVFPEYVQYRGTPDGFRASAAPVPGPTSAPFGALAHTMGAWVLGGSHAERSGDPDRPYNTAVLFDREGRLTARYRKLHLFDVRVDDGPSDMESARVTPGDRAVVAPVEGVAVGFSICYDLRFPELYRALSLAGAEVLAVPAVFTARTGEAHWEPLLRARAIENGAWVVAAAGCGEGGEGAIPAWGHSMVVDPWGRVVAQLGGDEGILRAEIDMDAVAAARRQIPALRNRRPDALPPAREVEVLP
ncbi:MAG TPA: carbon-nitrogen hydrolase family protein [Candidatus Limnocylindrales bacterium]|nr:carbon-nitrogen hydrolase family protein [Candidatus Limnocylindrales bacterium]